MFKKILSTMFAFMVFCSIGVTTANADSGDSVDVYTNAGEREIDGRKWRTTCEKYTSTMNRCRAEIYATQIAKVDGKFVKQNDWVFNNLTYLPVGKTQWGSNPLANGGEFNSDGRWWRTSCADEWTGKKGCRSFIWASVTSDSTGRFVTKDQWVFNNVVIFTDEVGLSINPDTTSNPQKAIYTVSKNGAFSAPVSGGNPIGNPLSVINADPTDKHLPYSEKRAKDFGIVSNLRIARKNGTVSTVTKEGQYNAVLAMKAIEKAEWSGVSDADKKKLAVMAVVAMAQESTFGTNPRAMNPNSDNDVGVYQQRSLVGWYADGDTQAENVKILTESIPYGTLTFIEGHIVSKQGPKPAGRLGYRIPGVFSKKEWRTREAWDVVTDVQRPAKSTYHHYENWQPVAEALVEIYYGK